MRRIHIQYGWCNNYDKSLLYVTYCIISLGLDVKSFFSIVNHTSSREKKKKIAWPLLSFKRWKKAINTFALILTSLRSVATSTRKRPPLFIPAVDRIASSPRAFKTAVIKSLYYSFKIFPRFWLVKTTRIIYHKHLLLTKFGKNFVILNRWRQNDVKSAAWLQVIEPLTEKTWGRGWVVLVVRTKWRNCRGTFHSFHLEMLS